jgi:hypothetical protein
MFSFFKICICCLTCLTFFQSGAQSQRPGVGQWRMHASFRTNNDIVVAHDLVYVGSRSAMFTYNTDTRELDILSRVSGLSDVSIQKLLYDPITRSVVVAYEDGNIDILQNNRVTNISDIYKRIIVGGKRINNMTLHNGRVYLSCSFGIVVIDVRSRRIVDSYQNIGPSGTTLEVLDLAFHQGYMYITCSLGVRKILEATFNRSDFTNWIPDKQASSAMDIKSYNGKLYAILDSSLWIWDGTVWTELNGFQNKQYISMRVSANKLLISSSEMFSIFDDNDELQEIPFARGARSACVGADGFVYALFDLLGMLRFSSSTSNIDYIQPQGPAGSFAQRIRYKNKQVWMAGDGVAGLGTSGGWGPKFTGNKMYLFQNNTFTNFLGTDPRIDAAPDIIDVAIHPTSQHAFFATFGSGVIEMSSQGVVNVYDTSNSSLRPVLSNDPRFTPIWIGGVDFDTRGNLWVSNNSALNPISVMQPNGQWRSFSIPSAINRAFGSITCDDHGNKWLINTRGNGLLVFRENDMNNPNDDEVKLLSTERQNGNLPNNTVFCVAKDNRGELWVGTSSGLCIFSSPQNVFRPNMDFDAKQLVIQSGSIFTNFLEDVPIYCITVDAANRKWIGTSNGAWLVSPDGFTVIHNFTRDNSPLPDNAVFEIGIDESTGEVFFATEKGMVSFMGSASEALTTYSNVEVYPNPITPEYEGEIAIKGLLQNSFVKITDLAGNLVFEQKSNGGMVVWNGVNIYGNKVPSGVYLIFASEPDGQVTHAGKLMVIR